MQKVTEQDGQSANIVDENVEQMKALFPDAFTEGGVDFDVLRQLLGDASVLDEGEEKYGLNWHGKKQARQIALTPSTGTLLPCPEESIDWDTTQNLFIEGDNLEVLKLLQKSYAGKVKMIYIDPPYNTGKEFIYPDKFQDNLDTYLRYTGQKSDDGLKFSSNSEDSGRYHTNWLNMIFPRLKLARNLLRDDGVLFISIDDHEVGNLRKILDEIFGENNFIGVFVVNSTPNARDYGHIGKMHEYALMYVKDSIKAETHQLPETDKKFKYEDGISGFNIHPLYNSNVAFNKDNRPNLYYPFYVNPDSMENNFHELSLDKKTGWIEVFPPESLKEQVQFVWRWGRKKSLENINIEIIGYRTNSGDYRVVQKMRHSSKLIRSLLIDKNYSTRRGTAEVEQLFGKKLFSFPKPVSLIKDFVSAGTENDDVILDIFAGSSTTAHAVLEANSADNGNRKFIMVQLPEDIQEYPEAKKAGYKNIADIAKERIRLVIDKIKQEVPNYLGDQGFKVYKLDYSNINTWNPDRTDLEATLLSHKDHLVEGRSEQDVLYELLLKRGIELTVPIEKKKVAGKTIYSIGYGVLFACLDTSIAKDDVDAVAGAIAEWHKELEPETDSHVFFRDSAFADDNAKTNMAANLEQNGIAHVRSL